MLSYSSGFPVSGVGPEVFPGAEELVGGIGSPR